MTSTIVGGSLYNSHAAAEFLGIQALTIRRLVQKKILTPIKVGRSNLFDIEELERVKREGFSQGMGHREIAARYGVSRETAAYHFRRLRARVVGHDRKRRRAMIYSEDTVKKIAEILGWEESQNRNDGSSGPSRAS
jgi:excisionase family DNA binding protein